MDACKKEHSLRHGDESAIDVHDVQQVQRQSSFLCTVCFATSNNLPRSASLNKPHRKEKGKLQTIQMERGLSDSLVPHATNNHF